MKKFAFIISLITITLFQDIYSQQIDSLGIDNSPILSEFESNYFNALFRDSRKDFDFRNVKAIFVTGNSGNELIEKNAYFTQKVKPWLATGNKPQTFFKILSTNEKDKSGGYDVIILSWVKLFTKRKRKKILRKIEKR